MLLLGGGRKKEKAGTAAPRRPSAVRGLAIPMCPTLSWTGGEAKRGMELDGGGQGPGIIVGPVAYFHHPFPLRSFRIDASDLNKFPAFGRSPLTEDSLLYRVSFCFCPPGEMVADDISIPSPPPPDLSSPWSDHVRSPTYHHYPPSLSFSSFPFLPLDRANQFRLFALISSSPPLARPRISPLAALQPIQP